MPSRRAVLGLIAGGLCGAFAGCIEPGGALDMTPVESDDALGSEATETPDPADTERRSLLETLIDEGSLERAGRSPDLETDWPVAYEDTVYDVSAEAVDETTQSGYEIRLTETDDTVDRTIAFEDLPEADQDRFPALSTRVEHHDDEEDRQLRTGAAVFDLDEAALEESVLVPEPEYDAVTTEGLTLSITVEETSRTIDVYRYEIETIADSVADYGASLREYEFTLDGLSDEEQELVETVVEEGSEVVGTDNEAYEGVGERLLEEKPVYAGDGEGHWIARYDDVPYWTGLDPVQYSSLREQLDERERP